MVKPFQINSKETYQNTNRRRLHIIRRRRRRNLNEREQRVVEREQQLNRRERQLAIRARRLRLFQQRDAQIDAQILQESIELEIEFDEEYLEQRRNNLPRINQRSNINQLQQPDYNFRSSIFNQSNYQPEEQHLQSNEDEIQEESDNYISDDEIRPVEEEDDESEYHNSDYSALATESETSYDYHLDLNFSGERWLMNPSIKYDNQISCAKKLALIENRLNTIETNQNSTTITNNNCTINNYYNQSEINNLYNEFEIKHFICMLCLEEKYFEGIPSSYYRCSTCGYPICKPCGKEIRKVRRECAIYHSRNDECRKKCGYCFLKDGRFKKGGFIPNAQFK